MENFAWFVIGVICSPFVMALYRGARKILSNAWQASHKK